MGGMMTRSDPEPLQGYALMLPQLPPAALFRWWCASSRGSSIHQWSMSTCPPTAAEKEHYIRLHWYSCSTSVVHACYSNPIGSYHCHLPGFGRMYVHECQVMMNTLPLLSRGGKANSSLSIWYTKTTQNTWQQWVHESHSRPPQDIITWLCW
jgi:hypothetical protein